MKIWRLTFVLCGAFWLFVAVGVMSLAHASEHRDRAICISTNDTISIYDNGTVYASNSDNALISLEMDREHPEISNSREWAYSVMRDYPEFKCKVLK